MALLLLATLIGLLSATVMVASWLRPPGLGLDPLGYTTGIALSLFVVVIAPRLIVSRVCRQLGRPWLIAWSLSLASALTPRSSRTPRSR